MGEIINATYNFLDSLDKSTIIKEITKHKQKLMHNKTILNEIDNIKKETNSKNKINKRKELYQNNDYKMYMKYYNELSFLILQINHKYKEYTNTKEGSCHE